VEQFERTRKLVRLIGLEEGRLRLEWISAAEGVRFAEVIDEFTDQVRALGPSPFGHAGTPDDLRAEMEEDADAVAEAGPATAAGRRA
jgi:F420-non-reducing hydrogenase iron-sulfur subunit